MGRNKTYTPEDAARWVRWYTSEGLSLDELAERAGRSPTTIARVLKREGVKLRPPCSGEHFRTAQTQRIEDALRTTNERGYIARLAERYGVTAARVSAIKTRMLRDEQREVHDDSEAA